MPAAVPASRCDDLVSILEGALAVIALQSTIPAMSAGCRTRGCAIKHVPAQIGDLIVWDYRLPHGNSQNLSARPRLAFYISMPPAGDAALRQANIESWRTGYCVPWWRDKPGYDRRECWAPAKFSELGRKLLGLDAW